MPAILYILHCADERYYYGITSDLMQRLEQHRKGQVPSTRLRRPIELVYFEEHATLHQARQRERSLKNHGMRDKSLARMIESLPPDKLAPFAGAVRPG